MTAAQSAPRKFSILFHAGEARIKFRLRSDAFDIKTVAVVTNP